MLSVQQESTLVSYPGQHNHCLSTGLPPELLMGFAAKKFYQKHYGNRDMPVCVKYKYSLNAFVEFCHTKILLTLKQCKMSVMLPYMIYEPYGGQNQTFLRFHIWMSISRSKTNNNTLNTVKMKKNHNTPKIEINCINWIRFAYGCIFFEKTKL